MNKKPNIFEMVTQCQNYWTIRLQALNVQFSNWIQETKNPKNFLVEVFLVSPNFTQTPPTNTQTGKTLS